MIAPESITQIDVTITTISGEQIKVMECEPYQFARIDIGDLTPKQRTQLLNAAYYLKRVFSVLVREDVVNYDQS